LRAALFHLYSLLQNGLVNITGWRVLRKNVFHTHCSRPQSRAAEAHKRNFVPHARESKSARNLGRHSPCLWLYSRTSDVCSKLYDRTGIVSLSHRIKANACTRAQGPARGADLEGLEMNDEIGKRMDPCANAMRTWKRGGCLPEVFPENRRWSTAGNEDGLIWLFACGMPFLSCTCASSTSELEG
jgi:hypothetical protein